MKYIVTYRLYYVGKYENHLPVLDSGIIDDVIQSDFGYTKFSGPDAGAAYMESS